MNLRECCELLDCILIENDKIKAAATDKDRIAWRRSHSWPWSTVLESPRAIFLHLHCNCTQWIYERKTLFRQIR